MIEVSKTYKISVLPGDGIGRDVIPQAVRVLQEVQDRVGGFQVELHEFECGGEYFLREGREWSTEAEEFTYKEADAVLLGAVGANDSEGRSVRLPDGNLAGYSIVIGLRMGLDLYANVRPVSLLDGVWTPIKDKTPDDINMTIIRENTEGLYAPVRGKLTRAGISEVAVDARIITRKGSERVARYAYELANRSSGAPSDGKKRVTCVDKSNLLAGCQLFRDSFNQVGADYPDIEKDYAYVDAWTQWVIRKPEHYNLVVAPNAFGDIITDLGAAIQGGLGVAPAGNIGDKHGVFEPVHGSAPKYYGQNVANPIAAILAMGMMLDWLGSSDGNKNIKIAADKVSESVALVLKDGKIRTRDLCVGEWSQIKPSSTQDVTTAIIEKMNSIDTGG
ncbi:isocitrate/isopropylmalate dehydrogenase family protein [Candidatus Thorarchaeota archaeon]|nr:MAG: isocitrate/isopropylmalate dehydrogenase family protein [Candidatus Thorarchaeota archaeon]